jgi:hypothetical protein
MDNTGSGYEQPDPDKPRPPRPEDKPAEFEAGIAGWAQQIDSPNLVPLFMGDEDGRKFLGKVAEQVHRDFQRDWENSEEYRERRKQNYNLYTGNLPKKVFPFEGCANAHQPIMLERILRLSANVFAEIFTDRETIFGVQATGPDDYETAEALTLHGNWQFRTELTDFLRQQERALQEFYSAGSVFSHSYYDPTRGRNCHDIMSCEEFIIPYVWVTTKVDLSDVPRKVRILRKYRHELEDLRDADEPHAWANIDEVLSHDPPGWDLLETKVRDQGEKREGIVKPDVDPTAPYVFYQYHGFFRMPGEKRTRPVCAIVESQHKIVVRLYINEEEDWRDRMRFDSQVEELNRYQQDMETHLQMAEKQQYLQARLAQPDIDPVEAGMLQEGLAADQVEPPQEPEWVMNDSVFDDATGTPAPRPVRRVPVEPFAHGCCVDNPAGALGLSFGTILADLNHLADQALNRFYDAGTLANIQSYIVAEGLDLGTANLNMAPGKIFKAKGVTGEQLKNMIHELRASPANPQLLDMARFATENADSAVAAPGVLSGEPGKSGETFRGLATRREQATKQLSASGIRYLSFLNQIIVNNARLNALFLPEHEVISVGNHFAEARKFTLDPAGRPKQEIGIGRSMYRRSYSVTFTADVRFTSQAQRIAEWDELFNMVMSAPPLQANPALIYAVTAGAFRARGVSQLIPMLGPPPPPPVMPLGMPPPMMPPGLGPPPDGAQPGGGPPPEEGQPAGVPLPAGMTGGIQGPRPEMDEVPQ